MRVVKALGVLAAIGLALLAWSYREATSAPIVRRARIGLPGWPASAPPVRAVLISDIHVAGPDMPPARLGRIVARINALRPDIVLIAGKGHEAGRTSRGETRPFDDRDELAGALEALGAGRSPR